MPIPQKIIDFFEVAYNLATSLIVSESIPQIGETFSGEYSLTVSKMLSKPLVCSSINFLFCRPSLIMTFIIAFRSKTSVPGLNCKK